MDHRHDLAQPGCSQQTATVFSDPGPGIVFEPVCIRTYTHVHLVQPQSNLSAKQTNWEHTISSTLKAAFLFINLNEHYGITSIAQALMYSCHLYLIMSSVSYLAESIQNCVSTYS